MQSSSTPSLLPFPAPVAGREGAVESPAAAGLPAAPAGLIFDGLLPAGHGRVPTLSRGEIAVPMEDLAFPAAFSELALGANDKPVLAMPAAAVTAENLLSPEELAQVLTNAEANGAVSAPATANAPALATIAASPATPPIEAVPNTKGQGTEAPAATPATPPARPTTQANPVLAEGAAPAKEAASPSASTHRSPATLPPSEPNRPASASPAKAPAPVHPLTSQPGSTVAIESPAADSPAQATKTPAGPDPIAQRPTAAGEPAVASTDFPIRGTVVTAEPVPAPVRLATPESPRMVASEAQPQAGRQPSPSPDALAVGQVGVAHASKGDAQSQVAPERPVAVADSSRIPAANGERNGANPLTRDAATPVVRPFDAPRAVGPAAQAPSTPTPAGESVAPGRATPEVRPAATADFAPQSAATDAGTMAAATSRPGRTQAANPAEATVGKPAAGTTVRAAATQPLERSAAAATEATADGESSPASERPADVAGKGSSELAMASPLSGEGWKKILLNTYKERLEYTSQAVGIKDAKADGIMPSVLSSPTSHVDAAAPVSNVSQAYSSLPAEWAEKLTQMMNRAERLAPARLEVSLPVEGGRDLRVQVSCRGGQVRCEFQNASSELRSMFLREWPGLAALFGKEGQVRVEQPTFVTFADRKAGAEDGSGQQQQQQSRRESAADREEDHDLAQFFTRTRRAARSVA